MSTPIMTESAKKTPPSPKSSGAGPPPRVSPDYGIPTSPPPKSLNYRQYMGSGHPEAPNTYPKLRAPNLVDTGPPHAPISQNGKGDDIPKALPKQKGDPSPKPSAVPSQGPPPPNRKQDHLERLKEAKVGDAQSLDEIRKLFDEDPAYCSRVGDVASMAETCWINRIAQNHLLPKEAITRQQKTMKADLAGPNPSVLMAKLADTVCIAWLALMFAETEAALSSDNPQEILVRSRNAESAQRRFTHAVQILELVKAKLPNSQPATRAEADDKNEKSTNPKGSAQAPRVGKNKGNA